MCYLICPGNGVFKQININNSYDNLNLKCAVLKPTSYLEDLVQKKVKLYTFKNIDYILR